MHNGNQVLRFDNKIKPKAVGGLGVELEARKGTGNYDATRTQFNIEFVSLGNYRTLSNKLYSTLYSNNIHFNKGDNTNILNGCIITSGPEFFQKLGLPMKPTGRKYVEGKNIGKDIYCPDIKDKNDIPFNVKEYFRSSHEFLCNLVGKENVIYSAVHFDEDTPHMHFYFIPVVNSVKRKVFETDANGKRITKEHINKKGITQNVPIQKRDENGKLVYRTEYGKFLDSDQFWKQKGGKASYAKIQDEYNEYINAQGFSLDRGKIGSNRHHKDKAEYNLDILKNEYELLNKEYEKNKKENEIELKTNKEILNMDNKVLSPSKDIFKRYKDKDIDELINYTKEVKKDNISSKNTIKKQDIKIEELTKEVNQLKSGETIKSKDEIIKKQENIINEQNTLIESLKNEINNLKSKLKHTMDLVVNKLNNAYLAVGRLLGIKDINKYNVNHNTMESKINNINRKYEKERDSGMEL